MHLETDCTIFLFLYYWALWSFQAISPTDWLPFHYYQMCFKNKDRRATSLFEINCTYNFLQVFTPTLAKQCATESKSSLPKQFNSFITENLSLEGES